MILRRSPLKARSAKQAARAANLRRTRPRAADEEEAK